MIAGCVVSPRQTRYAPSGDSGAAGRDAPSSDACFRRRGGRGGRVSWARAAAQTHPPTQHRNRGLALVTSQKIFICRRLHLSHLALLQTDERGRSCGTPVHGGLSRPDGRSSGCGTLLSAHSHEDPTAGFTICCRKSMPPRLRPGKVGRHVAPRTWCTSLTGECEMFLTWPAPCTLPAAHPVGPGSVLKSGRVRQRSTRSTDFLSRFPPPRDWTHRARPAQARAAFYHYAVAVTLAQLVYQTKTEHGLIYRFIPTTPRSSAGGKLRALGPRTELSTPNYAETAAPSCGQCPSRQWLTSIYPSRKTLAPRAARGPRLRPRQGSVLQKRVFSLHQRWPFATRANFFATAPARRKAHPPKNPTREHSNSISSPTTRPCSKVATTSRSRRGAI